MMGWWWSGAEFRENPASQAVLQHAPISLWTWLVRLHSGVSRSPLSYVYTNPTGLPVRGLGAFQGLRLLWIPFPEGGLIVSLQPCQSHRFVQETQPLSQSQRQLGQAQPSPAQVRRFMSSQEGGLGRKGGRMSLLEEEPRTPGAGVGRQRGGVPSRPAAAKWYLPLLAENTWVPRAQRHSLPSWGTPEPLPLLCPEASVASLSPSASFIQDR